MALKDWKKYREKANIIAWWSNKKQEGITIVQFMNNNKKWTFTIEGETIRNFLKKPQALAYAQKYMMTH